MGQQHGEGCGQVCAGRRGDLHRHVRAERSWFADVVRQRPRIAQDVGQPVRLGRGHDVVEEEVGQLDLVIVGAHAQAVLVKANEV